MKNNTMSFDVHMLLNTQNKNIDKSTLKNAIISTAKHRETTEDINACKEVVDILANSQTNCINQKQQQE